MQRFCIDCEKEYDNPGRRCNSCRSKRWKLANKERDREQRRAYYKRSYKPVVVADKRCEFCDKVFTPNKHTPNQPYCSKLCRERAWRRNNREYYTKKRKEERQRNRKWYAEYNKKYKNDKRFGGNKYKVLERDNNQCVDCGKDNPRSLVMHHIDFSGQSENPNNDMDNLETLCRACHIRKHTHVVVLK